MEEKENSSVRYDALLEEYKSLREEVLKRQDARLYILGFTLAAIGTIIGFALNEKDITRFEFDGYILALVTLALIILNAALILTIQYTQQIDIISSYIRKYIESKITEIGWETRWTHYRNLKKCNPKSAGLPLGTSKPLALFYALLTASVYYIASISKVNKFQIAFAIVSVLAIFSFFFSYDLYMRKTKGWKINWDLLDEGN